jgi:predicted transcriptional regulator
MELQNAVRKVLINQQKVGNITYTTFAKDNYISIRGLHYFIQGKNINATTLELIIKGLGYTVTLSKKL